MNKPTHTISVTHTLEEPRAAASINQQAQLAEYVSRGFILLTPEDLGVDASIHPQICQQTTKALHALEQQPQISCWQVFLRTKPAKRWPWDLMES